MPQIAGKDVGAIGFGLMGFTWRADPPPREQAFKAMRAALAHGANFWNGGELYGTAERNSLHLLREYFEQYPEDASKVVLSIKGGLVPGGMAPDGSEANVQRSIDECVNQLKGAKGAKHLELFEIARVDPKTPVETSVGQIKKNVDNGNLSGISLSEVSADTIRRSAKVGKISAVEVEVSLFSPDIFQNGIADACAELDIPIIAYSPLSRGILTEAFDSAENVPERLKQMFPRFQGEALQANLKLANEVRQLAKAKGVTTPQIAIAWVKGMSKRNGGPTIIPIPGATTEERVAENMKDITLTEEDMQTLDKFVKEANVQGDRYGGVVKSLMNG